MKSVGKVLKSILEIFIFAINVVLSLIVIVNLLVLLSSKVFNNEMPTLHIGRASCRERVLIKV